MTLQQKQGDRCNIEGNTCTIYTYTFYFFNKNLLLHGIWQIGKKKLWFANCVLQVENLNEEFY